MDPVHSDRAPKKSRAPDESRDDRPGAGAGDPIHADCRLVDPAATDRFGAALGARLRPGDVVALSGDLGAGKSALARAAIRARLGDPRAEVPSPTFTLIQIYEAAGLTLWHVDLYRLGEAEEASELGLEEAFAEAACLIEWPERLGAALPRDALRIALTQEGEGRRAAIAAPPPWAGRVAEILADV